MPGTRRRTEGQAWVEAWQTRTAENEVIGRRWWLDVAEFKERLEGS